MPVQANFPPILQGGSVGGERGEREGITFQTFGWKKGRDWKKWAVEERTGLGDVGRTDSHELGNLTMASGLDHFQAGNVLRMDPRGGGLHTHAGKISIAFFRTS